jgi:geranylgeranyl pyrophosphate synthase
MVQSKTSVLMRIGLKMIAIAGQLPAAELEKLERLANHLGTSFQIQDDIINLESTDYSKGRGGISGDDITEGKITLLVVRHVSTTNDQWLLDLLGLKTEDPRLIEQARRAMHESGAIAYCHQVKQAHMQQAVDLLESLAVPADRKESLRAVLSELLHRSK